MQMGMHMCVHVTPQVKYDAETAKATGKAAITKIEEHLRRFHIACDKVGAHEKMSEKEKVRVKEDE